MIALWRRFRVARALGRASADRAALASEVERLRVAIEEERVKNLLLTKEVDLMTAIHQRNLARWQADTPAVARDET